MNTQVSVAAALLLALAAPAATAQNQAAGPDAHFLSPDSEFFVADREFEGGYLNVTLARMLQPASPATSGEAEFQGIGGPKAGQRFWSRWFWRSRAARGEDLRIGRHVFCLDAQTNGVYRAPLNRAEATQISWFIAPIVDLSYLHRGQVIIDVYRADPNCLRVPEGSTDLPSTPPASLDAQFIDSVDYFVRTEEYEGGYGGNLTLARMVRSPTTTSGGEAEFVAIQSQGGRQTGQRFWTRWFWRTRPARSEDIGVGATVIVFDASDQNVHRPPHDRFEAVTSGWWIGAVTDLSAMFRGEVQVGDYQVRPTAMRVPVR